MFVVEITSKRSQSWIVLTWGVDYIYIIHTCIYIYISVCARVFACMHIHIDDIMLVCIIMTLYLKICSHHLQFGKSGHHISPNIKQILR